jgi:hypothetical protein
MHTEMKQGFHNVVKAIYQSYGLKGFVSGLTPSLIASVPGTPLMYLGTHLTTQILGESAPAKILSGYVGMATGCLVYVPPTIINQAKQTLAVNKQIQSMNHLQITKELYKRKGIAGFYTGYGLQIASFGTCNALGLFLTSEIVKVMNANEYSSSPVAFVSHVLGYTAAGILTNPLELIKRQRQAAWANPSMFPDKSTLGVVKRIVEKHGISGLYRGAHAYGFWAAARFGTAYATVDIIKDYLNEDKPKFRPK